jgi:hypothetical protein
MGQKSASHATNRVLQRLVALAVGDEGRAASIVSAALRVAGLAKLPTNGEEALDFAKRHLAPLLRHQVSSALVEAVMEDLAGELSSKTKAPTDTARNRRPVEMEKIDKEAEERPTKPAPSTANVPVVEVARHIRTTLSSPIVRSVLLVDPNRNVRAPLARSLIRANCDLTVRDSFAGLDVLDSFDGVVADVDDVAIDEFVELVIGGDRAPAVVAWTRSVKRADALLRAAGLDSFAVVSKDASPDEVVVALNKRWAAAAAGVK